jgi:hypothetical protein
MLGDDSPEELVASPLAETALSTDLFERLDQLRRSDAFEHVWGTDEEVEENITPLLEKLSVAYLGLKESAGSQDRTPVSPVADGQRRAVIIRNVMNALLQQLPEDADVRRRIAIKEFSDKTVAEPFHTTLHDDELKDMVVRAIEGVIKEHQSSVYVTTQVLKDIPKTASLEEINESVGSRNISVREASTFETGSGAVVLLLDDAVLLQPPRAKSDETNSLIRVETRQLKSPPVMGRKVEFCSRATNLLEELPPNASLDEINSHLRGHGLSATESPENGIGAGKVVRRLRSSVLLSGNETDELVEKGGLVNVAVRRLEKTSAQAGDIVSFCTTATVNNFANNMLMKALLDISLDAYAEAIKSEDNLPENHRIHEPLAQAADDLYERFRRNQQSPEFENYRMAAAINPISVDGYEALKRTITEMLEAPLQERKKAALQAREAAQQEKSSPSVARGKSTGLEARLKAAFKRKKTALPENDLPPSVASGMPDQAPIGLIGLEARLHAAFNAYKRTGNEADFSQPLRFFSDDQSGKLRVEFDQKLANRFNSVDRVNGVTTARLYATVHLEWMIKQQSLPSAILTKIAPPAPPDSHVFEPQIPTTSGALRSKSVIGAAPPQSPRNEESRLPVEASEQVERPVEKASQEIRGHEMSGREFDGYIFDALYEDSAQSQLARLVIVEKTNDQNIIHYLDASKVRFVDSAGQRILPEKGAHFRVTLPALLQLTKGPPLLTEHCEVFDLMGYMDEHAKFNSQKDEVIVKGKVAHVAPDRTIRVEITNGRQTRTPQILKYKQDPGEEMLSVNTIVSITLTKVQNQERQSPSPTQTRETGRKKGL